MLTFMGTGCISKTLRRLVSNSLMMSESMRSHRGLSGLLQCRKCWLAYAQPLRRPLKLLQVCTKLQCKPAHADVVSATQTGLSCLVSISRNSVALPGLLRGRHQPEVYLQT